VARDLLFRDYLSASAQARVDHTRSKLLAAERWSDDRIAYTDEKDEVIGALMADAESWALAGAATDSATPPRTA
jgi:GrpB-like predicted nucleotidyltransferase (UPF0157 family)